MKTVSPHPALWAFEQATVPPGAAQPGLMAGRAAWLLTLLGVPFAALLWPAYGPLALPLGLALGRLLALDLTSYLLPDLYTYPLITGGLAWAWFSGHSASAIVAVGLLLAVRELTLRLPLPSRGMGGGDFTLLAALCCWMGFGDAMWASALGSLLWLPVSFKFPRRHVPLGVPVILGWAIYSCVNTLWIH
jgi:prepilin signal peptidase PulO-like enzyme (type II secretory pathway)